MRLAARSPGPQAPPLLPAMLAEAERLCRERNVRLTARRRRVLEIVARSPGAVGAYEILDRLDDGRRPAPISVYRALEFLITQGLVHRIGSLNAYVACPQPARPHSAQFLVCRTCGSVAELIDPAVEAAIAGSASGTGFDVASSVVEVAGVCPDCRERDGP